MNELLSRQHFDSKAQAPSPDHGYHDLGLGAENTLSEEQTAGIDLVNEPQEWISGFDAGFNNRPLVPGNTQQYCEGYMHGQHAWKTPAASPSLSSATSELSSFGILDADTIDPRLLDLDASNDDDLFKMPTQLTIATRSVDSHKTTGHRDCDHPLSLSTSGLSRSNMQLSGSLAQCPPPALSDGTHELERGSGHLDINSCRFDDNSLYTKASDIHKASTPAPSWTPINVHKASHARSAPTARTPSPPLVTHVAHENVNHMSPCVRRSLSMAKHARVAAELLGSQGILGAAAASVAEAAHWEKKARRRQAKNDSQNRIRAEQRAVKLART